MNNKKISISTGNRKMGAIPSVSLPACVTCNPDAPCFKKCYAAKVARIYSPARDIFSDAQYLYAKGYRKASDVIAEIICEILSNHTPDIDGFFTIHQTDLTELKKKYEREGEKDNGNDNK